MTADTLLSQTAQALCCSCFCSVVNVLVLASRDVKERFAVYIHMHVHTAPVFELSAKAVVVVPSLQLMR